MKTQDLTMSLQVEQMPQQVFNAINNVGGWWTKIEGNSKKVNDSFTVRFGKVYITHQVAELVPGQKVFWQVTDSNVEDWVNTRINFDISAKKDGTEINFTHIGMHTGLGDYKDCVNGWNRFLNESLVKLLAEGQGSPY
jgi:hypothetical protein